MELQTNLENIVVDASVNPDLIHIERRREERIATNRITEIQSLSVFGRERLVGRILDVSRSGMRLRIERSFAPGKKLRIVFRNVLVDATVCYNRPASEGFDHGLKVFDVWEEPGVEFAGQ